MLMMFSRLGKYPFMPRIVRRSNPQRQPQFPRNKQIHPPIASGERKLNKPIDQNQENEKLIKEIHQTVAFLDQKLNYENKQIGDILKVVIVYCCISCLILFYLIILGKYQ